MKRITTIVIVMALMIGFGISAKAAYEPDVDYSSLMVSAATTGDYETGTAAEIARSEKIAALGISEPAFTFEDLMLLSKIIYAEAGSLWLSDEWRMCVGEVVLNRVDSPEFPDTIKDVIEQPGQYYGKNSRYFNSLIPSESCVNAALRLLRGERLMEPAVVFQANFVQGSGTHTACYDKYLGWTYFCFSSKPELYKDGAVQVDAPSTEEVNALQSDTESAKQPLE